MGKAFKVFAMLPPPPPTREFSEFGNIRFRGFVVIALPIAAAPVILETDGSGTELSSRLSASKAAERICRPPFAGLLAIATVLLLPEVAPNTLGMSNAFPGIIPDDARVLPAVGGFPLASPPADEAAVAEAVALDAPIILLSPPSIFI